MRGRAWVQVVNDMQHGSGRDRDRCRDRYSDRYRGGGGDSGSIVQSDIDGSNRFLMKEGVTQQDTGIGLARGMQLSRGHCKISPRLWLESCSPHIGQGNGFQSHR